MVKSDAMITGRVSLGPRNEYFRVAGRGFNSKVGGASKEGINGVLESAGNLSYFTVHGGVILELGDSKRALTSSAYPSKLSTSKWARQAYKGS